MMTLTSTQLGQLVAQFFLAGAGTLSFAVLFACPRRTLPCCALVGAVGWFIYELAVLYGADAAAASLIAVIPLSLAARICAILLKTPVTVFLLTGIWHGAGWTFIFWGIYHGFFNVLERCFLGKWLKQEKFRPLAHIYAVFVVLIGWIFFRADTIGQAFSFIRYMFVPHSAVVLMERYKITFTFYV